VAAWTILSTNLFGAGLMLNPYLALVVLLAVGAAVGMANGLLIVKGRLNGFMVTLAMTILVYGLQDGIVSDQSLFDLPRVFTYLGSAYLFSSGNGTGGVPVSLLVTVAIFVIVGLFLRYHRVGRAIYAVGGNREAARAAGIKVDRVRIGVYVVAGMLAAIGGLMEAGQTSQVSTLQGYSEGIIFPVFAAAVIGGVSLQGGRGNMLGAATGVALLGIVTNILDISQVSNYWIFAVQGAVILAALILSRIIGGRAAAEP
jgi:simple sugar transport system permease protein